MLSPSPSCAKKLYLIRYEIFVLLIYYSSSFNKQSLLKSWRYNATLSKTTAPAKLSNSQASLVG